MGRWFGRRAGAPTPYRAGTVGRRAQALLALLDQGALVADRTDDVVLANRRAYALRLVRGRRLAVPELRRLVRLVRRDGRTRKAELDLPGRRDRDTRPLAVRARVALVGGRHVVTVDGAPVALPLKEFALLETLLRNNDRVLTRDQLIHRVWGADYVGDTRTLDVHIKRLRARIEPDPADPHYLRTIRGVGYKLATGP
ncbi:MAG: winged helix-turn-helix domain-containing protein [Streptosporangiaceae bacterium]